MIECDCGATIAPIVVVRDDIGRQNRCPECGIHWTCCPSCYTWSRPFAHWNHRSNCSECGLDWDVKTALRLPVDRARGRTLRSIRADPQVPQFEPVGVDDAEPSIEHEDDGTVSV